MSDGPHRSLPMSRVWKNVASRADKSAYVQEEVVAALSDALERDWQELPPNFREALTQISGDAQQPSLLAPSIGQVRDLRLLASGSPFAALISDCAAQIAGEHVARTKAVETGLANAMYEWVARRSRQIEEHYCREAGQNRAAHVRGRLEGAISRGELRGLAARLLDGSGGGVQRRPSKKTGLDEGVRL